MEIHREMELRQAERESEKPNITRSIDVKFEERNSLFQSSKDWEN